MKKYENFCKALENLRDIYAYSQPYSNVIRTGLVALFSICFEQSWKAMKEILENQGYAESATGSPRMIIKTAYAAGMIEDEDLWLEALTQRYNANHAYNESVAETIIAKTKDGFVKMFADLAEQIEDSWLTI